MSEDTFVLVADPQQSRVADVMPTRRDGVSALNATLNKLQQVQWPSGMNLDPAIAGTPIGPVAATFIAGDLCDNGGGYDFFDQLAPSASQSGGIEQKLIRALYQAGLTRYPPSPVWKDVPTSLNCLQGPVYFGLGNHDVLDDNLPNVFWKDNWAFISSIDDFFRYESWNFIGQMHAGITWGQGRPALWAPTAIDNQDARGYDWKNNSFNYRVDLNVATIFHMHVYGGYADAGRADGITWLRAQMATLPADRPIFIVQHDTFITSEMLNPNLINVSWSVDQRNEFLRQLDGENVIGFLVGHVHNTYKAPTPQLVDADPVPGRTLYNFRPGAAFDQNFGVFHVSSGRLDVAFGTVDSNSNINWNMGWSGTVRAQPTKFLMGPWGTYSETDGFVDASPVTIPDDWTLEGAALWAKPVPVSDVTMISLTLICRDANGNVQRLRSDVSDNYFLGGRKDQDNGFFHHEMVECLPNHRVAGLQLFLYGNRVAVRLLCKDVDGGAIVNVDPVGWSGEGVPSQGYFETGDVGPVNAEVRGATFYAENNRASLQFYVID